MKDSDGAPLWHQHSVPGVLFHSSPDAVHSHSQHGGIRDEQKEGRLIISAQIL